MLFVLASFGSGGEIIVLLRFRQFTMFSLLYYLSFLSSFFTVSVTTLNGLFC